MPAAVGTPCPVLEFQLGAIPVPVDQGERMVTVARHQQGARVLCMPAPGADYGLAGQVADLIVRCCPDQWRYGMRS